MRRERSAGSAVNGQDGIVSEANRRGATNTGNTVDRKIMVRGELNRTGKAVAPPNERSPCLPRSNRERAGSAKRIHRILRFATDFERPDRLHPAAEVNRPTRGNRKLRRGAETRVLGKRHGTARHFGLADVGVGFAATDRDFAALKDNFAGRFVVVGDCRRKCGVSRKLGRIELQTVRRIGELNFAQAQRCIERIAFDGEDFAVCAAGAPDTVGCHGATAAVLDLALHCRCVEIDVKLPVCTVGNAAGCRHKRLLKAAQGVVGGENVPGAVEMNAAHRNVITAVDGEVATDLKLCVARIRVAHRNGREIDLRAALEHKTTEMTRIAPGAGNNEFAVIAENKLRLTQNVLRCRAAFKTHKTVRQRKGAEEGRRVRIGEAELVGAAAKIDVEGAATVENIVDRRTTALVECQGCLITERNPARTIKPLDRLIDTLIKNNVTLCNKLRGVAEAAVGRERNGHTRVDRRFAGVGIAGMVANDEVGIATRGRELQAVRTSFARIRHKRRELVVEPGTRKNRIADQSDFLQLRADLHGFVVLRELAVHSPNRFGNRRGDAVLHLVVLKHQAAEVNAVERNFSTLAEVQIAPDRDEVLVDDVAVIVREREIGFNRHPRERDRRAAVDVEVAGNVVRRSIGTDNKR